MENINLLWKKHPTPTPDENFGSSSPNFADFEKVSSKGIGGDISYDRFLNGS